MLLSVLVEPLEPLNEMLFLIIWQFLEYINHKDAVSTVAQTRTDIESFAFWIVDHHRVGWSPVQRAVEENTLLKEYVHLVVAEALDIVLGAWSLENVQVQDTS